MFQLYQYDRSSAAYRVRIALALKGIEWQSVPVNLLTNEHRDAVYLARNPQGLVPALRVGDDYLNQSLAIIEYLDEAYPDPALLPSDRLERAKVRAFAQQITMDIHPLNNLRVLNYLKQTDKEKTIWMHHWLTEGFNAIETLIASNRAASNASQSNALDKTPVMQTHFCFSGSASLADICLIPQVYNAKRFNLPMGDYPFIESVWQQCISLPAFLQAAPKKPPEEQ